MLTPAEEMGLAGARLEARVRAAVGKLPVAERLELLAKVEVEAKARHLWYLHDGVVETVRLMMKPLVVLPEQLAYVHVVTTTLHRALKRLAGLYFADPRVRSVLKLPETEEAWLLECWGQRQNDLNPVFGRLDAVADFTSSHWKETLKFLEPNMSGIGGLHMLPTADSIIREVVVPALTRVDPGLELISGPDLRDLLMQYMLDTMESLGRTTRTVCFIEPKYAGDGPDEQSMIAGCLEGRYQVKVLHADPAELRLVGDQVYFQDTPVDLGYRDYSVAEILALEKEGVDVRPMRQLLREDRMVSSIAAEIDQKSCWEVFTDPELAQAHFTTEERQIFRRHVLWTRIVSDRSTTLPDGTRGPLLDYAREAREMLVLKPNRGYGGYGVRLGAAVDSTEWDQALEEALVAPDRFVLQALTPLPVRDFPVRSPDGGVIDEAYYTVYGFAPTPFGVSVLGRASQRQVVNVAQKGGLFSLFVGR